MSDGHHDAAGPVLPRASARQRPARRAIVSRRGPLLRLGATALMAVATTGCVDMPQQATDPTSTDSSATPPTSTPTDRTSDGLAAEVVEVTDGDTLQARIDGTVERVRLIGINAPETGECFADDARHALADLAADLQVRLEQDTSDRDQYGRLLAYVFANGEHVNAALVRGGFAIARPYPPDTARADELASAQREAEQAGVGMWGADGCASDVDAEGIALSVQADAPGDDNANLNGEWVEIRNTGNGPLDLSGWTVKDESATHRHLFAAGTTIAAGTMLRLYTGCGEDTPTERYWCRTNSAVWNNTGDTAFLLDPDGRTVTTHAY